MAVEIGGLGFCPTSVTIYTTLVSFAVLNFLLSQIVNWSDSKDSSNSDFAMISFFNVEKKNDVNPFSHLFVS